MTENKDLNASQDQSDSPSVAPESANKGRHILTDAQFAALYHWVDGRLSQLIGLEAELAAMNLRLASGVSSEDNASRPR